MRPRALPLVRPPAARRPAEAGFLDFGAIIGAIWSGIKYLASKAADLAIFLARAAIQAGKQIWNVLKLLARHAKQFAMWVKDRVVQLWRLYLRPLIEAVWRSLLRVQAFLYKHLGFLLRWARTLAEWLLTVWTKVVMPILNAIEWARRVMQLLSALGVRWAAAVDKWLAKLQKQIYDAFLWVQGLVNKALYWLNLILTPEGLLQGVLLVSSMDPIAGAIVRMLVRKGVLGWSQEDRAIQTERTPHRPVEEQLADLESGRIAQSPLGDTVFKHALDILQRAGR